MAEFIYSDSHFYHSKILEYENRPFKDVDEMNMELVCRWNSVVGPKDTVYHLGDFGLGKKEDLRYILSLMNGYKHLILGNHDRGPNAMMEIGFNTITRSWPLERGGKHIFMVHNPDHYAKEPWHGHDFVLYGHLHSRRVEKYDKMEGWVNCCVENSDYYPIPLEKILSKEYNGRSKS